MTSLKYKDTDGTWKVIPIVGPPGAGVPVGGALGDVLIKQSAVDRATRWGIDPPKLQLTDPTAATLAGVNVTPLTLGNNAGTNLVGYSTGIQARNNGAASLLRLNYYGGGVEIGGGHTDQYATMLTIAETQHATSRRASLTIGQGWGIGQDLNANGTKDFYLFNNVNNRTVMTVNADGMTVNLGTTLTNFKVQVGSAGRAILQVGDDAYLVDTDLTTGFAVRGVQDSNRGELALGGSNANRIWGNSSAGYAGFMSMGDMYLDFNTVHFRTIAGADKASLDNSGNFGVNGQVYCGSGAYFRVRGTGSGIYWDNVGVGLVANAGGWLQMYPGTNLSMENGKIRLKLYNDDNHYLVAGTETPTGSGEASDGPRLAGYRSVWLYNVSANKGLYLSSAGNCFLYAGNTYNTFSSREFKDNIEPLDPDDCLDTVRRWRPVEFDYRDDELGYAPGRRHGEGFIAEEMVEVTPNVVNVTGPDNERPGWANAIDYSQLTPWLAGAVQALLARIEALEAA